MSQTFTPKMKKPNIVILNGLVEEVQPVQTQDARRWRLFNYQRDAVLLRLQTDHEIYGGHHPVLVTSSQAAEIASTYVHGCISENEKVRFDKKVTSRKSRWFAKNPTQNGDYTWNLALTSFCATQPSSG